MTSCSMCGFTSTGSVSQSRLHVQGQQFALSDVEVVTATVNLDEISTYRGAIASLQDQASAAPPYPVVQVLTPKLS